MRDPQFWLGNDNHEVWEANVSQGHEPAGQHLFGFPAGRREAVKNMRVGDIIINYMKKDATYFAAWEIVGEYRHDSGHILAGEAYPECVMVKAIVLVDPPEGVPVHDLLEELETFQTLSDPPRQWGVRVKTSAVKLSSHDGEIILQRLREVADRQNGRGPGAPNA